jgi:hypothetical protein
MNQRRTLRLETDQSVWITVFGEPNVQLPGRIKNVSVRGVGLELQGPIAAGAPIKIDLDDGLLLGEVMYCRQDDTCFYVGVELEHSLCGLADLAQALREYADSPSGPEQADSVKERRYQN